MKKLFILIFSVCLLIPSTASACTDFVVKAKDNTVVNGRSMEFPIDLKSEILIIPRGIQHTCADKKGIRGSNWTSKYGFLGINAFGLKDCFVEGFNEKGLAVGGLMFGDAKYQKAAPGKFVPVDSLAAWILGNFATVDDVKAALPTVTVCDTDVKKLKSLGMHIAVHDATGKNLVIEFIGGQIKVYDNPLGVMTNSPDFPWQMTNLRNYINLDSLNRAPKTLNSVRIEPTGVGSGLLGLPGDWTPPSRFVRMAICKDTALKPGNAKEAVNLAEHLLNMVDIPKGAIKEKPESFITMYGYAQWVLIKDLTNKVLYYKTYDNSAWKSVDLKKFDLKPGAAIRSIAIDSNILSVTDVSGQLK
ncbi:MAG: choloylglycine hydrolase family protein [Candidatus Saganbacteria bacterium]|nr:choloylglycine hydrolase family protein [Candidatus Saganbacteria bacterium]